MHNFFPLDSMLKALLYIYVSLLSFYGLAQTTIPEWTSPSESVTEDPNHIISEVTGFKSEKSGVTLTWKVSNEVPGFYAIERSDNAKDFEMVGVLNNIGIHTVYQWIDEAPKKGKSFYRIRYSFKDGRPLYSKTVSVVIDGYSSFKFYPNPVDNLLIIRSNTPADVQISDGNGKVRISELRLQGLRTVNVSALEKGIYLIRFSNKLTNVISQEKLIKN